MISIEISVTDSLGANANTTVIADIANEFLFAALHVPGISQGIANVVANPESFWIPVLQI